MTLKDRLKSESTQFGKILKTWVAGILGLISIVGGMGEWLGMLPPAILEVVPSWVKTVVFAAATISYIYGHWTVKPKQNEQV